MGPPQALHSVQATAKGSRKHTPPPPDGPKHIDATGNPYTPPESPPVTSSLSPSPDYCSLDGTPYPMRDKPLTLKDCTPKGSPNVDALPFKMPLPLTFVKNDCGQVHSKWNVVPTGHVPMKAMPDYVILRAIANQVLPCLRRK